MQKVLNYGSFLQAYALKQLLLQAGADEVYFIDIEKGHALPGFERKSQSLCEKMNQIWNVAMAGELFKYMRDKKFYNRFNKTMKNSLSILELDKKTPKVFDLVVIGSDEVFNCCQGSPWGYTLQLFGRVDNAKHVISYAGSFGHTTYEQLVNLKIDKEIGDTMKTMSVISVRDLNSYSIVEKITGLQPKIHLDPVLIHGYRKEIEESKTHYLKKYVIVYSYQGRINDKNEVREIVNFAKKHNLELISIFCRYDWCDRVVVPETPFGILGWFKGAEYVITDTFHGTIFSIITERNFVTLIRTTNEEKISSLLHQLHLDKRCIDINKEELSSKLVVRPDWDVVHNVLENERCRSRLYLKNAITLS